MIRDHIHCRVMTGDCLEDTLTVIDLKMTTTHHTDIVRDLENGTFRLDRPRSKQRIFDHLDSGVTT